jgi:hypothetical protein
MLPTVPYRVLCLHVLMLQYLAEIEKKDETRLYYKYIYNVCQVISCEKMSLFLST